MDYRLCSQQFGDTFVFFSPLATDDGDISLIPMYLMLVACCWAMTISLAAKIAIRGSLCVGSGVEIAENTFYGPVLSEAHFLERTAARYPRIVLSPEAAKVAGQDRGFSNNPKIETITTMDASRCRSLLWQESDGFWVVDYLGEGARALMPAAAPEWTGAIENAYRFARSEAARLWDAKDYKLAPRYTLLQHYFEARLPTWGLAHLREADNGG